MPWKATVVLPLNPFWRWDLVPCVLVVIPSEYLLLKCSVDCEPNLSFLQVMSILSNPSAMAPQPQHDFSISPLHSGLEASNPISGSCSQRSEPIKTAESLASSQSYCPPTYSSTSYSVDPVTAGYQYSQYGQSEYITTQTHNQPSGFLSWMSYWPRLLLLVL